MTLDEPRNPFHAAALERGENPENPSAKFRLATLLSQHDDLLSIHAYMLIAGRVLAFLPRIVAWVDAEKPRVASKQLRRQQVAEADNETFFLEQAHYHLGGYRDAMAALASMGSVYAADYDPESRGERDDDRRLSVERADSEAAAGMPRVAS